LGSVDVRISLSNKSLFRQEIEVRLQVPGEVERNRFLFRVEFQQLPVTFKELR